MSKVREQVKAFAERKGLIKHSAVISACVMMALALTLLFVAVFAPFKYLSRNVVYIKYSDEQKQESVRVAVYQNKGVHQSLFKVLSAAEALGDAGTLHAFASGGVVDPSKRQEAVERLEKLRKDYSDIYVRSIEKASQKGISPSDEKFKKILARELAGMSLMELDLLEISVIEDNDEEYKSMYAAVVVAMLAGIIELALMALCLAALAFSILRLILKTPFKEMDALLRLFALLSSAGLFMCMFISTALPASGPLALCCISVCVYYFCGLAKSLVSDGPDSALVKNVIAATVIPVAMLCLASVPSYAMFINGFGGQYIYYYGTVGTMRYAWAQATVAAGAEVPRNALDSALVLAAICGAVTTALSYRALDRLYKNERGRDLVLYIGALVAAAIAFSLIISGHAMSASVAGDGKAVKYIPCSCWYACAVLNAVCGVVLLLSERMDKSEGDMLRAPASDEQPMSEEQLASEAEK